MASGRGAKPKTHQVQKPGHPKELKYNLHNGIRLRIRHGNILEAKSGAVVVGESGTFNGKGAIAKALLKLGGPSYKKARDEMIQAAEASTHNQALVHVSSAGIMLPFEKVFHAVIASPRTFQYDQSNWYKHVEAVFFQIGEMAEKHKMTEVATPLLGTGAAKGDVDVSLQAAVAALAKLSPNHLEDVIIVEYELDKAALLEDKLKDLFKKNPEFLGSDRKGASTQEQQRQQPKPRKQDIGSSGPAYQPEKPTQSRRQLPETPTSSSRGNNEEFSHANPKPSPTSRKNGGSSAAPQASRPASGQGRKQTPSNSSGSNPPGGCSGKDASQAVSSPVTARPSSRNARSPPAAAPAAGQAQRQTVPQHHNNSNKNEAISQAMRRDKSGSKKQSRDCQGLKEKPRDSSNNASKRTGRQSRQSTSTDLDDVTAKIGSLSIDETNNQNNAAGPKGQNNASNTGQTQQTKLSNQLPGFSPGPGQAGYPPQQRNMQDPNFPAPSQPVPVNTQCYNTGQQQSQAVYQQAIPSGQAPGFSPNPSQAGYPPQGPPYPQQGNGQYPSFPTPHQLAQFNSQTCNMWQQQGPAPFPIPCRRPENVSEAEWNRRLEHVWRVVQRQQAQNSSYGWNPTVLPQPGQIQQQPVPHQGHPVGENQSHPLPQGQHFDGNPAGVVQLQYLHQVQQGLNPGYGTGPQAPQPQQDFSGDGRQQGIRAGNTSVFTVRAPLQSGTDGQENISRGSRYTPPEEHHQAGERGEGRRGLYPDLTNVEKQSSQPPPQSSMAGQGPETQTSTRASPRGDNLVSPSSNVPCSEVYTAPGPAAGRQRPDREAVQQVMDRGDHRPSPDRMPREEDLAGDTFVESWRRGLSNPGNFPTWARGHVSGDDSQEFLELPVDRSHAERETSPPPLSQQPHSPRQWAEGQLESQSQDRDQASNRPRAGDRVEESAHGEKIMEYSEKEDKKEKEEEEYQEEEEEEEVVEPAAEPAEEDQEEEGQGRDEIQSSNSYRGRSQSEEDDWEFVEREAQKRELTPHPQTNQGHCSREPGGKIPDNDENRTHSSRKDQEQGVSSSRDDPSPQEENEMRRRRQKHENPETKPGTSESPPVREDEAEEDEHNEGSRKTTAQEQSSMPEGKMATVVKENVHLEGFKPTCGTIVIEYSFANGVQQEGHPAPGQPYKGTFRRAFLPDNREGQRVLQLLHTAFDRKLTFQLQQTGPDGEWVMEFADIPHKTSLKGGSKGNGYPDPDYLPLVKAILASLEIK